MAATGVELATAYVTLAVSTRGMERDIRGQFSRVESQAGKTGARAGKAMGGGILAAAKSYAGPIAAAFAGVKVAQFFSDAVTAGSDLQQNMGGVAAVFKKQAATIEKSAAASAQALGLSRNAYLQMATVLGATLKNKGVKDFTKQTQTLIKTGADLAAQFGGSTQEAVDALASAMRGEMDPIERYGVSLNEAALKAEALRLGLVKGKGPLGIQAKALTVLSLIQRQSADAMGAAAREAGTYASRQRQLSATWANMKAQIGTALLPALTRVSEWFLKTGLPAVQRFGGGVKALGDLLFRGDFTGALRKAFGWAEDSGQVDFLFRVRDGFIQVKDAAQDFRAWMLNNLWPALQKGFDTIRPGLERAGEIIRGAFGGESGVALKDFGNLLAEKIIPAVAQFVNVWLPIMATQLRGTIEVVKAAGAVFEAWRNSMARVYSFLIDKFISLADVGAKMLDALSSVPGFDWAADAANKLRDMTEVARGVKTAMDRITDKHVDITVNAKLNLPGRLKVADQYINVGMREAGGPVRKGQPYIVGEKRPELFVPDQNGTILPRVDGSAPAAMGGFDPRPIGDAVYDAMRGARFAVDTEDNARATARYRNTRSQW